MKYTGIPSTMIPNAAMESTGASISGSVTRNTAAINISMGIGKNTYCGESIHKYSIFYIVNGDHTCTSVLIYLVSHGQTSFLQILGLAHFQHRSCSMKPYKY